MLILLASLAGLLVTAATCAAVAPRPFRAARPEHRKPYRTL